MTEEHINPVLILDVFEILDRYDPDIFHKEMMLKAIREVTEGTSLYMIGEHTRFCEACMQVFYSEWDFHQNCTKKRLE